MKRSLAHHGSQPVLSILFNFFLCNSNVYIVSLLIPEALHIYINP